MICPKCGREYPRLLAVSRRDNTTQICDDCGAKEAIEDWEEFERLREEENDESAGKN